MNLETDDPEKGQLLQRSAHHREVLDEEMKALVDKSEKILTNALIIGGALALVVMAVILRGLSGSSKKRKAKSKKVQLVTGKEDADLDEETGHVEEPGIVSQLGSVLMAQATGLLLSIAREKLVEFLQSQAAKKDNSHERS